MFSTLRNALGRRPATPNRTPSRPRARRPAVESLETRLALTLGVEQFFWGLPSRGESSVVSATGESIVAEITYTGVNPKTNAGVGSALVLRAYNSAGKLTAANSFTLSTTDSSVYSSPKLAADSAGNFWVTYTVYTGTHSVVDATRFNPSLQRVSALNVPVANYAGSSYDPSVGSDQSGNIEVTFTYLPTGSGAKPQVWAQRISAGGAKGATIAVANDASGSQYGGRIAETPDGHFDIIYEASYGGPAAIFLKRYNASGAVTGNLIPVAVAPLNATEADGAISMSNAGAVVVVWDQDYNNGSSTDAYLRRVSSTGTTGNVVRLTTDGQAVYPSVAVNPVSGSFVVAFSLGLHDAQVWVEEWSSAGALTHQYHPSNGSYPNYFTTVTFNASGRYLVTYTQQAPNTSVVGEFGSFS